MSEICVGENLRRYRKGRGLSQQRLAMLSGVARRTIAKYELDQGCNMETARLERLARVLGISMVDLFRHPGDEQETLQSERKIVKRALGASGAILLIIAVVAITRAQATPEAMMATIDPLTSAWQMQKPASPAIATPSSGEPQTPAQPDQGQPEMPIGATAEGSGPGAAEPSFYRSDNPVASPSAASTPTMSPQADPTVSSPVSSSASEEQPINVSQPAASTAPEPDLDTAGKSGKVPPGQLKKNT